MVATPGGMRFQRRSWWVSYAARTENLVMLAVGLTVGVVILYPLGTLLLQSVRIERWDQPTVYTLSNFADIFGNERTLRALGNTLASSAASTCLATLLGVPLAWIVARTNTPWRAALELINLVPFFVSPLVMALAWIYLAAPRVGLLNNWLQAAFGLAEGPLNVYSLWGIILVMTIFYTPEMCLFTVGSFAKMDPSLEESARVTGSGLWQTTWRVTIPLALPSILSGALTVFATSAGVLGVPLLLGLPVGIRTLSTQIQALASEYPVNYGGAAAAAVLLLAITVVGLAVQRAVVARAAYTTVTGKGYRPNIIDLGMWRYATLAFNLVYLLVAVVLPFSALAVVAFTQVWRGVVAVDQFTLGNFGYVLFQFDMTAISIRNSLFLALVGASVTMGLALVVAFLLHRTTVRGRAALDYAATIPIGVPGIVMGIGLLVAWVKSPLYGTIWILLVAYVARFLPYGLRVLSAVMLSLSKELDECSRTTGASWACTMGRITVPLLRSGIASGWLLILINIVKELPVAVLLWTESTIVMAVALVTLNIQKLPGHTAAFALIQTAILLLATLAYRKIAQNDRISM